MKTTTAYGIREDQTDCGPSPAMGRSRREPEASGSGTGRRGVAMMRIAQRKARLSAGLRQTLPDLRTFGAGEGARTLDPDLGKVVLYH